MRDWEFSPPGNAYFPAGREITPSGPSLFPTLPSMTAPGAEQRAPEREYQQEPSKRTAARTKRRWRQALITASATAVTLSAILAPIKAVEMPSEEPDVSVVEPAEPEEPTWPLYGTCGEALFWSLEDGILTISGDGNMEDFILEVAPWREAGESGAIAVVVIEKGVTSIGVNAFHGCVGITDLYYRGTEEEWRRIEGHHTIDESVSIHFDGE